ncbi:urease accessory protein UreE [Helicobacter cappadocius]|uniref:Urease accessory protein UreE n=1 Tax=Helicobacter cappadocius TaxID=3063998 RepID=A0AA90PYM6_9HELI|nr:MULTISPECIES: urease accessory protein UreE [unclassified Helicobacter]MDO7252909.1 urease accessory protein UreE [Helicobacter sp. faydin-H75]MDP2538953.1 urease accessory protein UreE [Helicobacter sp. faydin-H76]
MLIEHLEGNLKDRDFSAFKIDYVDLEWYDSRKKIARWKTRNGKEISVRLSNPPKMGFSQGDILHQNENEIIAINILPTLVLRLIATSPAEIAKICYEIGNRHASLFFGDNEFEFKTPFEKPLKVLFDKLDIKNDILNSILDSAYRISVSMAHSEPVFKVKASPDLKITISGEKN